MQFYAFPSPVFSDVTVLNITGPSYWSQWDLPSLPGEEDFLDAIRSDTEDQAPGLIYLDWLEEQGHPEVAEIRDLILRGVHGPEWQVKEHHRSEQEWTEEDLTESAHVRAAEGRFTAGLDGWDFWVGDLEPDLDAEIPF
jgi:uncharacterized protein (TIGR02996 family)